MLKKRVLRGVKMNAQKQIKPSESDTIFLMVQFNDQTRKWGINSATVALKHAIPEQDKAVQLKQLVEQQFPQSNVRFHKPFHISPE
jgi:hypothetical protein